MTAFLVESNFSASKALPRNSAHLRSANDLLTKIQQAAVGDADVTRRAWETLTGDVPESIEALIPVDGFFDSAIALGEFVLGQDQLLGWRVEYSSRGGPYSASLFIRDAPNSTTKKYAETSNISFHRR
jgi:hypothetical protein